MSPKMSPKKNDCASINVPQMKSSNWADEGDSSEEEEEDEEELNDKEQKGERISSHHSSAIVENIQRDEAVDNTNQFIKGPSNLKPTLLGPPFVAFVGNLEPSIDEDTIGNFFHNGGCIVTNVHFRYDENKKFRGFAHVEFRDSESLERALTANGFQISKTGRKLRVDLVRAEKSGAPRQKREPRDRFDKKADQKEGWEARKGPGRDDSFRKRDRKADRKTNDPQTSQIQDVEKAPSEPQHPKYSKDVFAKVVLSSHDGQRVGKTSIFGEGKPQDATAYMVRTKR